MARKQKLKVYRTPIGFHDAYVAAPSQRAALRAWGADVDLFARGVADMVDDEAMMRAPLDAPGTVIRVARGTSEEHIAALPADTPPRRKPATISDDDDGPPPRRRARSKEKNTSQRVAANSPARSEAVPTPPKPTARSKPAVRPKPRPSRATLYEAEQALDRARTDHDDAIADIRRQEKALVQKRRELEKRHEAALAKLEAAVSRARAAYGAAIEKWRS